ncbi:hypothetical protein [Candidatus Nitrosocosmicus sp. SS]|uniref:hypothetical protein n=1 Tax=Candidatus Nitrosocosmicus agrestis TaxID=2563600 RepID=UPI00122E6D63|nr:hypothetical protein [Candidatus Nitrosocosmicus sp. SS]KAA2282918.1 hypothetical protein F1Z66_04420 [Candidatus Nitrosocosmicus sp. SS]KAF0869120.1 hypothetical protein E5N71_06700 [Candidatus Nitrosocosmicus sp. SS]MDR4489530.1 hypothetical protein [Candidatus Nitrosocosmicus sp.]
MDFIGSRNQLINQSIKLHITGHTLVYDHIREISKRFSDIDITILHLVGGDRILEIRVTMYVRQGLCLKNKSETSYSGTLQ